MQSAARDNPLRARTRNTTQRTSAIPIAEVRKQKFL